MKSTIHPFPTLLLLAALFPACAAAEPDDELYRGFHSPPASARPFVRWWWNGNRVTAGEAVRELDVLREAGIGGVEINAIAMPRVAGENLDAIAPALEWLSPEWNRVVKAAAVGARERGMIADLIIGSGWPFGGRFLQPGELLQLVTVQKERLRGPGRYSRSLAELTRGTFRTWDPVHREEVDPSLPARLMFLRLVSAAASVPEPGQDLLPGAVRGNRVEFDIPGGEYELYAGSWREGFRQVELGAPGADGPVVDHFNHDAVRRYLDRVSGRLVPELGGPLGDHFRAVFCDSLELGEANWTGDFADQFRIRRGYDPMPWLHYMVDPEPPPENHPAGGTIRRLRYDFNRTIADLFEERFLGTLVEWAHANGVKARVQAYGREAHSLDASLRVDLPEGETWIWGSERIPYPTASNRFVASAAHLAGRRVVSAESMTNTTTTFRTLPWELKQTGDLNFISGITHFVLHGFNFSPPEAGFPGWVQFGTYFSEHSTWWPYMRQWSDYAARLCWVLQNSDAQARVGILTPDVDVWSDWGRPYYPFPEREAPLYAWRLWESLHRAGWNVDYLSDRILDGARVKGGGLQYGDRRYEAILVPGLKRMEPATARRLVEFARSGGRIVFVERMPSQGPSYTDLGEGDGVVQAAMAVLREELRDHVLQVEAPPEASALQWAVRLMAAAGIEPDVRLDPPSEAVSQIHHRAGDRDIFLMVHSGLEGAVELTAEFPGLGKRTAWRWDPETGERSVWRAQGEGRYRLRFEPLESLLLVFEPSSPPEDAPLWEPPPESEGVVLDPTWVLRFRHGVTGEEWEQVSPVLFDLGASPEVRLQTFAGAVDYSAEVEVDRTDWSWLDLGVVHGVSEARLNGHPLGVRWYGRHRYLVKRWLKPGLNRLEIRVATHLGNYARSLKDNPAAQRWAHWFPVEPMGLLGPVRLR